MSIFPIKEILEPVEIPHFSYDEIGYKEAKLFLESINKFNSVSDLSGYEIVHYANFLYSDKEDKK